MDGDTAPPEALPDVEDEGVDEPTSQVRQYRLLTRIYLIPRQSSQWEGDEVYKDVIKNYQVCRVPPSPKSIPQFAS